MADGSLLNFESRTSIQLAILLSDNGVPVLATFAPVTISITDINESPNGSDGSFTLDENAANGTAVGLIVGEDPDADPSLTYAIMSGNTDGAFSIDSATGQITVANTAVLDFETTPTFFVSVLVTDNGNPSLSHDAVMTINLNDVSEVLGVGVDVVPGNSTNTFRRNAKCEVPFSWKPLTIGRIEIDEPRPAGDLGSFPKSDSWQ